MLPRLEDEQVGPEVTDRPGDRIGIGGGRGPDAFDPRSEPAGDRRFRRQDDGPSARRIGHPMRRIIRIDADLSPTPRGTAFEERPSQGLHNPRGLFDGESPIPFQPLAEGAVTLPLGEPAVPSEPAS